MQLERMNQAMGAGPAVEVEIKLALPARADHRALAARIAALPVLARRKARHETVYSVYYDSPQQALRQQRAALRLRRVDALDAAGAADTAGAAAGPQRTPQATQWLQTLKTSAPPGKPLGAGAAAHTAGAAHSALSQRGEWEMPVAGPALELARLAGLAGSPWPALDRDGALAAALQPCFVTDFERSRWSVRLPAGSAGAGTGAALIEVALDLGQITTDAGSAPIAELELELRSGPPEALFVLARRIARSVPLLPLAASKAERGYALRQAGQAAAQTAQASAPGLAPGDAQNSAQFMPQAVTARPVALPAGLALAAIARLALGEMFQQLSANLYALQHTRPQAPYRTRAEAEYVHQARVGWRRFHSLYRLLRPGLPPGLPLPQWTALKPLLKSLGALRDLDVARLHTLPALTRGFIADAPQRQGDWQALQAALEQAAARELAALHQVMQTPAPGLVLLDWVQWLASVDGPLALPPAARDAAAQLPAGGKSSRRWLRRRIRRLTRRLDAALAEAADGDPQAQHRARILAKRLRYASEALAALLPGRQRRRHAKALAWQDLLGATRDSAQAGRLAERLGAAPELAAFLRGVAVGRSAH